MATSTISGQIQLRRDTAANWATENPVLLAGELGLESDTGNAKFGDGTTAWNSLKYAFQRNNSRNIEYIVGTQTASTASLTGVTEDAELYDGKLIAYYLPYASKSNATMNLTLADGTTTGAKPVYIVNTTRLGTQYSAGTIFTMVYSETKDAWYCGDYYNSNTYDRTYWNTNLVASEAIVAGHIIVGDANGYKHANTGVSFDVTYPILYAYGAVKANATFANAYLFMPSINPNTTVAGWSDSAEAELMSTVFLVGTLSGTTFTLDSTTFMTCNVPTAEDGKIYIPVGVTSASIKTSMYFRQGTEVFFYKDGAFRKYSYTASSGSVTWNDVTGKPSFATVATSGSYNDLSNKPTIPSAYTLPTASSTTLGGIKVGTNLSISNGVLSATDTKAWADITGKPTFATVATSGSYNDLSNKPTIPTVPTNVSAFTNDSGYITSAHETNNNRNIEYIVGTQTATTGAWKGVTQDTALYDGKLILYFLPCAGSGNATLELTFPNLTTTGAIPVYLGSSGVNGTRMTTQLAVKTQGAPVLLAYDEKNNIWGAMQYWTDANTYDRNLLNDIRVYAGTNKIMNYSLVMEKADGKWESFTTTSGTGTSKTKNTSGFRLGRIWVYNYNETISSGSLTRNDYLYDCIPLTLTYSTNCGTTLVAQKPVYLVGTIGNDGLFYLADTWWTQTEPTTEDGKVYIYLGDAYSTSAIYKVAHNTAYWYKDGALRQYSYVSENVINDLIDAKIALITDG